MANKNLDNSSLVPRISMSALRETKTHLQKRLNKYDQEEEKQLRKLKQSQECLMKDLKGPGLDQQNADLLTKQKKLMELRRARFSAPSFNSVRRPSVRGQLSDPLEGDSDVKVQDLLVLPSAKTPSSTLKATWPTSRSSRQSFSAPASPRELSGRELEERNVLVNRAVSKQEKITLKPPPLQLSPHAQQRLRLNDEYVRGKSPSEAATAEADIAIVDIEQEAENNGDKEDRNEFWKVLEKRGIPDSDSTGQSVKTQEGRKEDATQTGEAGVSKVENRRRRKIGIQHCVNEIAPAFNGSVLLNEESLTQSIDCSRESRSLSTMSYIDEQRGSTWKPGDASNGFPINNATQMRRASSVSQISTSSGRKASFSGTEKIASTLRLSVDGAVDLHLHGDVYTDINTPQLTRKTSLNQRVLWRGSDSELERTHKDSIDQHEIDANGEGKSSVSQMAAVENFRRLAFLSLGSASSSFSGREKAMKIASAKPQPERKLSRARLEEIQKPTESSSRQLITKHRSVSVLGAHPKLHEQLSAPELSRRTAPSGLRNFRKLSSSVVATNVLSAKQRRWSSVVKPTLPVQANEEKSLSEMMTDVKDCRYLRNFVASHDTEGDT